MKMVRAVIDANIIAIIYRQIEGWLLRQKAFNFFPPSRVKPTGSSKLRYDWADQMFDSGRR